MTIQEKCGKLNNDIHNRMYLDNYFSSKFGNYEQAFTSIDVIEDCQDAIDEFESIPENEIKNRTTLYIYGVLQSIYCQLEGINNSLSKIKDELKLRYNNQIPESTDYTLKTLDYILRKFENWFSNNELLNNKGSEIFFISLNKQIEELEYMLKEIDNEYNS